MAALSYGERTHYESLREGNQAAGNLLAGMQSGLGADKSAAYQKTGEALEAALGKREALGGDKNVVQSKATSDTVVAKNQQDINKTLGYGNDKGSDFSRIQELSKYQAAQELAKTESGQKFLKEMGVLDNKNDINKDALNNMTDTQAAEMRNNLIESETKQKVLDLIKFMTNEEKIWTKHISKDLMGFSETTVDMYIEYCANLICKNLKLDLIYPETDGGPLYKLYNIKSLLEIIKILKFKL
jgi:hypothetical protein